MAALPAPAFRRLLASRINTTSDALRKAAALQLRREFGLSLLEWRTLCLIEHMQPVRLRDVAAESQADKAQISRVVTGLQRRGLVRKEALGFDARAAYIELSTSGSELALKLAAMGEAREADLRALLGDGPSTQLIQWLDVVKARALQHVQEEERLLPAPPSGTEPASAGSATPA